MVRFGGSKFSGFRRASVPLVFAGRYFVIEPGDGTPLVSVVREEEGELVFEVARNEPVEDPPGVTVMKTPPGVVTVADATGGFLYKIRPGSETSVVFGKVAGGDDFSVKINDYEVVVLRGEKRVLTVRRSQFVGDMAGIVIRPDGGTSMGTRIPPILARILNALPSR
jgi:hypothetical protein